jgi:hypothetical protein
MRIIIGIKNIDVKYFVMNIKVITIESFFMFLIQIENKKKIASRLQKLFYIYNEF